MRPKQRFTLKWDGGRYTVSKPNIDTVEVVDSDSYDELAAELQKIEQLSDERWNELQSVKQSLKSASETVLRQIEELEQLRGELFELQEDRDRLDFLQSMLDEKRYTGYAVLRWSNTGRGMRLHETDDMEAYCSIRAAIDDFIEQDREGEV